MRPCALVGASGFLGRRLADALLADRLIVGRLGPPALADDHVLVWAAGRRPPSFDYEANARDLDAFLDASRPAALVLVSSVVADRPDSAYARSKLAQESVAISHGIPVRIARLVTLYGNVDPSEPVDRLAVVDRWIREARMGGPIRCARSAVADMMDVGDAARAIADLTRAPWTSAVERWDVGSGRAWGLEGLAAQVARLTGVRIEMLAPAWPGPVAGANGPRWRSTPTWDPPGWIDSQLEGDDASGGHRIGSRRARDS